MALAALKKMVIKAFSDPQYSSLVDTFTVMFNPNTYTQKYEVEYHDRQGQGDSGSPQVFGKIKPQEYTFDFVFDGTGVAAETIEVQDEVDKFLKLAGKYSGDIHRPMYLELFWGSLVSKCVLKSAEITYTLFKRDGFPLRAKVKATFAEDIDDALRVAKERKNSPDLTHVHVVHAGEKLPQLCYQYYRDAGRYLQVAMYNQVNNFRKLEPGQQLLFPPIKDSRTRGT